MKWLEANPLPAQCHDCQEEDCCNCDCAGKRWYLSQEDGLRIRRKGLIKAIERLQRQVQDIDRQLFWECLEVCTCENDMDKFFELCAKHPEHIAELKRRSQQEPNKSKEQERWITLRAKLVESLGEEWVKEHCID